MVELLKAMKLYFDRKLSKFKYCMECMGILPDQHYENCTLGKLLKAYEVAKDKEVPLKNLLLAIKELNKHVSENHTICPVCSNTLAHHVDDCRFKRVVDALEKVIG